MWNWFHHHCERIPWIGGQGASAEPQFQNWWFWTLNTSNFVFEFWSNLHILNLTRQSANEAKLNLTKHIPLNEREHRYSLSNWLLSFNIVLGVDIYRFWGCCVQIVWGRYFKLKSWLESGKALGIIV